MPLDSSTSITIAGIECWDEDVTEEFARDNNQAIRIIVCAWVNRYALINTLIGSSVTSGGITTINQPHAYPDAGWMYVKSIAVGKEGVPLVGANGMIAYPWARLTVTYGPKDPGGGDAIEVGEENLDFSSEIFTFSRDIPSFKWSSDNKDVPAEASPGKIIPIIAFSKTKKRISQLPLTTLFAISQAPVNASEYLGASAGKLRFCGARTSRVLAIGGTETWTMTCSFEFRPIPWNYMFRPSTGIFEAIVTKNGGAPLYASSEFSTLGLT